MPTYEYRCLNCRKRFDLFLSYSDYGKKSVTCPHCASANVQRKINRVRVARTEAQRLDRFSDTASLEGMDEDPRALGKMMREMSSEIGEDVGPEFNEVVSRLESGQSADDIEKAMPDLGAADSGGSDL
ncbi:MAG: FmdB family zinc ribbon protein [Anaerolineaceae bacterium]